MFSVRHVELLDKDQNNLTSACHKGKKSFTQYEVLKLNHKK